MFSRFTVLIVVIFLSFCSLYSIGSDAEVFASSDYLAVESLGVEVPQMMQDDCDLLTESDFLNADIVLEEFDPGAFEAFVRERLSVPEGPLLKYEDVDFDEVECWQVEPEKAENFQLLDANRIAVYSGEIKVNNKPRKLVDGYLRLHFEKQYYIPRAPNDKAVLKNHGFDENSLKNIKKFRNTGRKRKRKEVQAIVPKPKKMRYSEIDFIPLTLDILDKSVCWRVHPNYDGVFQLLDAKYTVLFSRLVKTSQGTRTLKKGFLQLVLAKKSYLFPRHSDDKESLFLNGFSEVTLDKIEVYQPFTEQVLSVQVLEKADFWRVHPNQKGILQLVDSEGNPVYAEKVRTRKGLRKFNRKNLVLRCGGKNYPFKRHPMDDKDLILNDFDPNSVAQYLQKSKKEKFTNHDFSRVKSWRIHPEKTGFLELLDAKGDPIYCEKIRLKDGSLRSLKRGFLTLHQRKKDYPFKRHRADEKDLVSNGFVKGQKASYVREERAITEELESLQMVDFWRISRTEPGVFELLDIDGDVVYSEAIRNSRGGTRSLKRGKLRVQYKKRSYTFLRQRDDSADLILNGFAKGSVAKKQEF